LGDLRLGEIERLKIEEIEIKNGRMGLEIMRLEIGN